MKPKFPWAKALKISPQQISEWQDMAPPEIPLPFWCVENGHLTSEEYLDWACEHFALPVLQNEFFDGAPPFEKPPGDWHPWFCPVGEWDGILYVACVEPPPEKSKFNQPMCLVLASPAALQKAWTANPSAPEIPDGFTIQAKKKTILQLDGLDNVKPEPKKAPKPIEDHTMVTASSILAPEEPDLEMTSVKTPPLPTKPAPAAKPKPVPKETATNISLVSKVKLPPPPASLDDADTPEKAFAWAFAQVIGRYTHAMALQETNNQMLPWLWSNNWKAPKNILNKSTSLDQPSLFRIAGKTRRPYHGFIVESDIHKEFFNAWGFETLPACATAVPIIVQDHVWGLLLCIGKESSESPEALKLAEQTAEEVSQCLSSQIAAA